MVIRPRIRAFLAALGLYVLAALFIGYFGSTPIPAIMASRRGRRSTTQIADLGRELDAAKAERAALGAPRRACCKSDSIDPDMLDERARQLLDYADPRDVIVLIRPH